MQYRLGPPVDARGELPDGRTFDGYVQFRDYLAAQPEVLAKALVTKLLTFACGREMGYSDRPEIERIVRNTAAGGWGLNDLLHAVIASETFQTK